MISFPGRTTPATRSLTGIEHAWNSGWRRERDSSRPRRPWSRRGQRPHCGLCLHPPFESFPIYVTKEAPKLGAFFVGAEKGIRTLDTVPRIHDFQSCALDQLSHLCTARVAPWLYYNNRFQNASNILFLPGGFLRLCSSLLDAKSNYRFVCTFYVRFFLFSEPVRNLQLTNTLHTDNIIRNELFHFQR